MRRISIVALAVVCLAGPAVASAQEGGANWADKSGTFGIGFTQTLGGQSGLNARLELSQLFGLELTLGFGLEIDDPDMADAENVITFNASIYGVIRFAYWAKGSLGAIFGFDFGLTSDSRDTDATTDIALGLGLQGEWFPIEHLSLFLQGGFRLEFLGDDDAGVVPGAGGGELSGIDLQLGADLFGAAGFTVWFN